MFKGDWQMLDFPAGARCKYHLNNDFHIDSFRKKLGSYDGYICTVIGMSVQQGFVNITFPGMAGCFTVHYSELTPLGKPATSIRGISGLGI
jgi:hypothetical protein